MSSVASWLPVLAISFALVAWWRSVGAMNEPAVLRGTSEVYARLTSRRTGLLSLPDEVRGLLSLEGGAVSFTPEGDSAPAWSFPAATFLDLRHCGQAVLEVRHPQLGDMRIDVSIRPVLAGWTFGLFQTNADGAAAKRFVRAVLTAIETSVGESAEVVESNQADALDELEPAMDFDSCLYAWMPRPGAVAGMVETGVLGLRDGMVSFLPDGSTVPRWSYPARTFDGLYLMSRFTSVFGTRLAGDHPQLGPLRIEVAARPPRVADISGFYDVSDPEAAELFLAAIGDAADASTNRGPFG